MEGPTPVSSLLHSCTLVMAGLFTLLRISLPEISGVTLMFMALSGIFVAAYSQVDRDAKKIVATSTVAMCIFL